MTLAIKRANGDIIWFDAVLSYPEDYSGQVTQHPVEDGSNVSDNFVIGNERFQLQGVISDSDFNTNRPSNIDGNIKNNEKVLDSVIIQSSKSNNLLSLLPENLAGLLEKDDEVFVFVSALRSLAYQEIKDTLKEIWSKGEGVTLLSYRKGIPDKPKTSCIITNMSIPETIETGESLEASLSMEQIRVAVTRVGVAPKLQSISTLEAEAASLQRTGGTGVGNGSVEIPEIPSQEIFGRKSIAKQITERGR